MIAIDDVLTVHRPHQAPLVKKEVLKRKDHRAFECGDFSGALRLTGKDAVTVKAVVDGGRFVLGVLMGTGDVVLVDVRNVSGNAQRA